MRPKTLSVEHQLQLNDLHNEIKIIKDNHLAHMAADIDNLSVEIKDAKELFDKRFDKLDNRLWWIVGIALTTLIGVVVGAM
jgi:hypothetical protein